MKTPASKIEEPAFILLVDDNQNGLVARKTVLQELGYRIVTASSGDEALQLFGQAKFDLVVTDFRMPNMTGTELIGHIRKAEPRLPVILLSGFVEPLGLTEQNTGADVVIAKCAGEVGHLVRSVNRLLHRRITRKPPASQTSSKSDRLRSSVTA